MSYRDIKLSGRSCSLLWVDGHGDTIEADLLVNFLGTKGIDYNPYGDTTVTAPWSEITEVEEYLLDDMPVTYQYLVEKFGKEDVDAAVKEAEDGAEEDDE